ncbi:MAG: alpha/beta hydrolase [Nannocystaceae bacterium]|nr:alpha/beta hydrolase [Nannocystaceae bacterium]
MSGWRRGSLKALSSLAFTYVSICVLMFVAQSRLLFHPTSIPEVEHMRLEALPDVEALSLDVGGETLEGFFLAGRGDEPRPTILYFGGNAESVWRQVDEKRWVANIGFNLVVVSYRGYDRSTGSASGEAITSDALTVYDRVVERADVDAQRVLTWGVSLGTGVATHVACHRPVAGVILMAPYDTLASVAAAQYPFLPVRALFQHEIDSLACGAKIESPALILHGDLDTTIAPSHGKALADAWGGDAQWVLLKDVGHNDISSHADVRTELTTFLQRCSDTAR